MKSGSQFSRLPLTIAAAAVFAAMGSAGAMAQQSSSQNQPNQARATQSQSQSNASQTGQTQANASQPGQAQASGGSRDLQQIEQQNPDLSTFIKALHATGLESSLNTGGRYTLFAPTDKAFKSMSDMTVQQLMQPQNRQQLISLLRSHIVADNVTPKMAHQLKKAETLNGNTVDLSANNGHIMVGSAKVVGKSIQQGNIRVYPIDKVQFMGTSEQASNASGSQNGQSGQEQARNVPKNGNQSQQ